MLWNISDEGEADKCNKCYYHIRNISSIRHYITRNDCKTLAHALITSRLDYGLPGTMMTCLQRVQNAAAQLVTCTQKWQHIMPVLNSLQWLPVIYKILVYAYKTPNRTAPQYLDELIIPYQPRWSLRIKSESLNSVPEMQGVIYGNSCFRRAKSTSGTTFY